MKMKCSILACLFLGMLMLVGCKEDEIIIEAEVAVQLQKRKHRLQKSRQIRFMYMCAVK